MPDTHILIARAYAAFNRRDIEGVFALMDGDVCWPKASEGGDAVGKDEIRAYWTRQWSEFDPYVDPLQMVDGPDGTTDVRVHQVVKDLDGKVLSDSEVWHRYTFCNGLICHMALKQGGGAGTAPSAAFSSH